MAVAEAPLRETKFGLVADVDGWFVLNARDSRWRDYGPLGIGCNFEGKRAFRQLGVNVNVLEPGQSLGLYHRENHQEGFLVVSDLAELLFVSPTPPQSSRTSTRPIKINPAAGHCQPRSRSGRNGQPNTMTQNGIV